MAGSAVSQGRQAQRGGDGLRSPDPLEATQRGRTGPMGRAGKLKDVSQQREGTMNARKARHHRRLDARHD